MRYATLALIFMMLLAALLPAAEDKPAAPAAPAAPQAATVPVIRIGIIGLDTSHAPAFTQIFNDPKATADVAGFRVTAAYPKGSEDIKSSTSRVPEYTESVKRHGVAIVDSIEALIAQVDVVLLESNDGRPHLKQAIPVIKAGKPLFIDKPVAGSLADAIAIFDLAEKHKTPIFTSSSLRFVPNAQAIRGGKFGKVRGADAWSPCPYEPTHPDLFWYGIHGVETLFTVMGAGCISVQRAHTPDVDLVTGVWADGRIGTFRGLRSGAKKYGGTAFTDQTITPIGDFGGYRVLAVEIAAFFKTRKPPVSSAESLEIYAFMQAADESKKAGGAPIKIQQVMDQARAELARRPASP